MESLIDTLRAWLRSTRRGVRAYQAATADAQHPARPYYADTSPDADVGRAGTALTAWGRHLDQNHDLAEAVLDELCTHIVGGGITIVPTPRVGGDRLADAISYALEDWSHQADVTGTLSRAEMEYLACRGWMREGEVFGQHVMAATAYPWPEGAVRYRVEYLPAAMVPWDDYDLAQQPETASGWRHGVRRNAWGVPTAYRVFLSHPYDDSLTTFDPGAAGSSTATKVVPAERMMHLRHQREHPQVRGVSRLAGVIRRLHDLADYEDSERIAARVAASFCAYLKRSPELGEPAPAEGLSGEREMRMQSGKIFADLLPGEEIGTIDSKRPNPELTAYRQGQLQAIAGGTGTRYSAIARDWSGSYSAQRQELVEARAMYARLRAVFVEQWVRPMYLAWLRVAIAQGVIRVGAADFASVSRAQYLGPAVPWIDPLKEIEATERAIAAGLMTREQALAERGLSPRLVPAPAAAPEETPDDDATDDSAAA